jgi:hypothetical protein
VSVRKEPVGVSVRKEPVPWFLVFLNQLTKSWEPNDFIEANISLASGRILHVTVMFLTELTNNFHPARDELSLYIL